MTKREEIETGMKGIVCDLSFHAAHEAAVKIVDIRNVIDDVVVKSAIGLNAATILYRGMLEASLDAGMPRDIALWHLETLSNAIRKLVEEKAENDSAKAH